MIIQPILDLVAICSQKGIKNAILSPGSRCAPITLAFIRHPEIHTRTISDERSAAFIALGIAQQLEKPVALVCTSGSAALNYGPAIAEAYFQQIPLLIITADRPPEWIDQWDGQTVRQQNLYGRHVKSSFDFPDELTHPDKIWHAQRIVNEAINMALQFPAGPVHINIPLREPFYPDKNEVFEYPQKPQLIETVPATYGWSDNTSIKMKSALSNFHKILIVPGQQRPDTNIQALLDQLSGEGKAVVVTDTISNLQSNFTVNFHDHFLKIGSNLEKLQPDLIITFGKSIISKNLKTFLRNSKASHWHIQPQGYIPDPFQKLSKHITSSPAFFLNFLTENLESASERFHSHWLGLDGLMQKHYPNIVDQADFGELKAMAKCLEMIPVNSKIHLANSMVVRYVNFLGKRDQEVICNRGASGIDGSVSTAVGCVFTTKDPVTLLTGDMAFFYDRNAFWHNYSMPNLRVIVFNNHGGGIFRLIDGSSEQPELEEYFETKQALDASHLASEYGFQYMYTEDEIELKEALKDFYKASVQPKILEIRTESEKNAQILSWVKGEISKTL